MTAATELRPPPEVVEIASTLEKAGFETWCVGGAVRDAMLGQPHLDWDFATAAQPAQVRKLFRRTIPVGVKYGTMGVLDARGVMHEVTTFRRDVATDGRHAVVEFGVSLDEDLSRRDFTMNAVAYSPTRRVLHDPFGGAGDIKRRVVRAVGDAARRMHEDRLRALRAIRFSARYGFEIDAETWTAIVDSAPHLGRLSAERVRQEIEKTLEQVDCPSIAFRLWREAGAFDSLLPGLAGVTDRSLAVIDELARPRAAGHSRRRSLRVAALLASATGDTEQMMRDLKFPNADIKWTIELLSRWRPLHAEMTAALAGATPGEGVVRRWAARCGRTRAAYVLRLAAAEWTAAGRAGEPAPEDRVVRRVYRRMLRVAYRDPIEIGDLAVDGTDLERIGFSGPAVGKGLKRLLAAVVEDPSLNNVEKLTAMARQGDR